MTPKDKKNRRNRRALSLLVWYLLAVLVWVLACTVKLAHAGILRENGSLPRVELAPGDVESGGVWWPEDFEESRRFITIDADPQLVLREDAGFCVEKFVFRGRPLNKGSGEMVLYYTTAVGEDFSESKKLWASQLEENTWVFDLGGKKVTALRFDPDSRGGVVWQADALVLNEEKSPVEYYLPRGRGVFALLFVPLFLWAVWGEIKAFFRPVFARRRFESRWRESG